MFKQGTHQAVELVCKPAVLIEKQQVYIGGETEVFSQHIHIIRYPAQYHVTLNYVVKAEYNVPVCQKFRTFRNCHRVEVYLARHASVQPAFVVHQIVHYPRCRRAAYYEHKVVLGRAPAVPEVFILRSSCSFFSEHVYAEYGAYVEFRHVRDAEGLADGGETVPVRRSVEVDADAEGARDC